MTAVELAKALAVDQGTVSRWRKRGCPIGNLAEAQNWVAANILRKGRRGPRGSQRRSVPVSEPLQPAKIVQEANCGPGKANGEVLVSALKGSSTPDQILGRLDEIERHAFTQAMDAIDEKLPAASWVVKVHKDAARNVIDGRELCLRAAERERLLVSGPRMAQLAAKRSSLIANVARAMPRQLAPRVHSGTLEDAERELTSWVQNQFLKTLYAAYGEHVDG